MSIPHGTNTADPGLVFYDGFNSGRLDRTKWNVRVTGRTVNNEQQAYVDSEETIYIAAGEETQGSDGYALVLHPRFHPGYSIPEGNTFDFISGRLDTRQNFEFMYGVASARMKLSAGAGLWPAFWMMGNGHWPATGEVDIMENVGEPDWISAGLHGPNYFGESGLVNYRYFPKETDVTDWHVYAAHWFPDQFEFRVDDELIYRVTRPMVEFFGNWAFDNPKYLILNFALGGTYPYKTNGIRSPYYGISTETVELVRRNQAKVLVDWVQVTRLNA